MRSPRSGAEASLCWTARPLPNAFSGPCGRRAPIAKPERWPAKAMNIDEINMLSRTAFVDALGWVFEHSPWVAERAWKHRPFPSLAALHATMTREVEAASREEQLALLRAHPDLGARRKMSAASSNEQAGAGL